MFNFHNPPNIVKKGDRVRLMGKSWEEWQSPLHDSFRVDDPYKIAEAHALD